MEEFVILYHEMPNFSRRDNHWDFMLRENSHLLTWECGSQPLKSRSLNCRRLANHRLVYLEFEGELTKDRGTVTRVAQGMFKWLARENEDNWIIELVMDDRNRWIAQMTNSDQLSLHNVD